MILLAIYDSDPVVGQAICDCSEQIPESVKREIDLVSRFYGEPQLTDDVLVPSLRFSPFGGKYLLTLGRRVRKERVYNRLAHFLMDEDETAELFKSDWKKTYDFLCDIFYSDAERWCYERY